MLFLASRLGRWITGGLALALIIGGAVIWLRNDAVHDLIKDITEKNNETISAAQAAELGLRDCLDRFADGLRWDFEAGRCTAPAGDPGR